MNLFRVGYFFCSGTHRKIYHHYISTNIKRHRVSYPENLCNQIILIPRPISSQWRLMCITLCILYNFEDYLHDLYLCIIICWRQDAGMGHMGPGQTSNRATSSGIKNMSENDVWLHRNDTYTNNQYKLQKTGNRRCLIYEGPYYKQMPHN
jgi:hypothetical protein